LDLVDGRTEILLGAEAFDASRGLETFVVQFG
jgi:hypothetical protein